MINDRVAVDLNLAGLNVNLDQMHFYFTILMHKMNLRYVNVSSEKIL